VGRAAMVNLGAAGAAPSIWIILLNWNGLADTMACLASLRDAAPGPYCVRTLVVDSASQTDPRPALAAAFPAVRLERLERNMGFTGGCNYGMRLALAEGADYVVLLNNDTVVEPGFLAPLIEQLERHDEVGVAGPLIALFEPPDRIWFAGGRFTLATGGARHRLLGRPTAAAPRAPFATDFMSGCCMALRARDLRRHGLFEEGYFAYYEDVELCLRLRRAGLAAVCVPQSRIRHRVSASTRQAGGPAPLAYYFGIRNRVALVRRHGGRAERALFLLAFNPLRLAYYLLTLAARRRWQALAWLFLGLVHGLQGRLGGTAW
jgi:GT2 family glycosyltransferase